MNATLPTSKPASILCESDAGLFRKNFNLHSFEFGHLLENHPLFELPRLEALGGRLSAIPENIYFNAGDIKVAQRFDESPLGKLTLAETFQRIEEANSWVVLKHVEQDPEYKALLRAIMDEVENLLGYSLEEKYRALEGIIIVTSPGRITSYHIDSECNFLFQIKGQKTFNVFDQTDREVLSHEEIEAYHAGDQCVAKYREELQDRAAVYQMRPGSAVHVPVFAPHWAKNTDNVSISLSFNFEMIEADLAGEVYRFNKYLRHFGIKPQPPGNSALRDGLKRVAFRGIQSAGRLTGQSKSPGKL